MNIIKILCKKKAFKLSSHPLEDQQDFRGSVNASSSFSLSFCFYHVTGAALIQMPTQHLDLWEEEERKE